MNLNAFAYLITGILLNATAQFLLKMGTKAIGEIHLNANNWLSTGIQLATQWPILGGIACYGISLIVWIIGLSRVDVTIAYPMLSLGYVVTAVAAWCFLGEAMSMQRIFAIGIIIVGVALLVKS